MSTTEIKQEIDELIERKNKAITTQALRIKELESNELPKIKQLEDQIQTIQYELEREIEIRSELESKKRRITIFEYIFILFLIVYAVCLFVIYLKTSENLKCKKICSFW